MNRPGYANNWYHGSWRPWYGRPSFWYGAAAGATAGWMLAPGQTFAYSNPYYVQPTTVVEAPIYDYSQPIPVATPQPAAPDAPPPEQPA